MVNVKHNGEVFSIPTSWAEVTVGQLIDIRDNANDNIDALAILTGKQRDYWAAQTEIFKVDVLFSMINWILTPPNTAGYLKPDNLLINSKRYRLPSALGLHTVDQQYCFEDMLSANTSKNDIDLVIPSLAIYFQPLIDGSKFDRDRLPEIEKLISKCIISEAFPVAAFFLKKYEELLQQRAKPLSTRLQVSKEEQELKISKSLVSLARLSLFRRVCFVVLRWFSKKVIVKSLLGYGTTKSSQPSKKD